MRPGVLSPPLSQVDDSPTRAHASVELLLASASDSPEQLLQELMDLLTANGAQVLDLFLSWGVDPDEPLSIIELGRVLTALRIEVPPDTVQALYEEIDDDTPSKRKVTSNELSYWILQRVDRIEMQQLEIQDAVRARGSHVMEIVAEQRVGASGTVTAAELTSVLEEIGMRAAATPARAQAILEELEVRDYMTHTCAALACVCAVRPFTHMPSASFCRLPHIRHLPHMTRCAHIYHLSRCTERQAYTRKSRAHLKHG